MSDHIEILRVISLIQPTVLPKLSIRVGPDGGGGSVIPDDLHGIKACISPGVGSNSQFELAMAELGISSFLADHSVEGPSINHPSFTFTKKYVSNFSDDKTIGFSEYLDSLNVEDGDLLLQMDIEGSEFESILDLTDTQMLSFRIIVLEIHGVEMIGTRYGRALLSSLFTRLTKSHHVTHLHPNNYSKPFKIKGVEVPSCIEITLIRKDRKSAFRIDSWQVGPDSLDTPCVPNKREVFLTEDWFR
jgi:hypothetical protein